MSMNCQACLCDSFLFHCYILFDEFGHIDTKVLVDTTKESLEIKVAFSKSFGFDHQNLLIIFAPKKNYEIILLIIECF